MTAVSVRSAITRVGQIESGNKMDIISSSSAAEASNYNETEVRFHILDPIVRALGYPGKNNVYLNLEEKLEYPYVHIGRRSKKDLPLGFPDYRAGLKGARGSFVIEAKAGNVKITSREIEQAHSYAAHAQVGANYFVLCNGEEIVIFETLSGHSAEPLVQMPLLEVNQRFHEIQNILSPESLAKNCTIEYDNKLRLCEGLGSSVRIRGGEYKVSDYGYRIFFNGADQTDTLKPLLPQLGELDAQFKLLQDDFELRISDGIAERDDDGRITASVQFAGVTKGNAAAMKLLGIDQMSFVTRDKFLSCSSTEPTMFETIKDFGVQKGAILPQFLGPAVQMEADLDAQVQVRAAMYVNDNSINGEYLAISLYKADIPLMGQFEVVLELVGTFDMILDV